MRRCCQCGRGGTAFVPDRGGGDGDSGAGEDCGCRPRCGGDRFRPKIHRACGLVPHPPEPVRGTDGRFHIAYELVLTNTVQFALDVKRVEVRDAKTHRVLLSL